MEQCSYRDYWSWYSTTLIRIEINKNQMRNNHTLNNGIPISISLNPVLEQAHFQARKSYDKKRIFTISALAVLIAVCISFIAKLLVYLIDLFTNISFYGNFSIEPSSPADNTYSEVQNEEVRYSIVLCFTQFF
jgi:hypothetical protein